MKSISIYTITRNQNIEQLQKLERQLSGRDYFLKMREWELESMKALTAELETCMEDVYALRFFYSFQIPRLGKEFDLLQIKEDQIINIELKSGVVSDEAIRRQLLQNRYYLSVLGRTIHSYTYISSQNRLVRLTNHDHIAEADWDELCRALKRESPDYDGKYRRTVPRRTLSDLTAQRAGTLFTERIFSDGTAKRYRTTDPERNPCKTFRLLLVQRTSGDGKDVASV